MDSKLQPTNSSDWVFHELMIRPWFQHKTSDILDNNTVMTAVFDNLQVVGDLSKLILKDYDAY